MAAVGVLLERRTHKLCGMALLPAALFAALAFLVQSPEIVAAEDVVTPTADNASQGPVQFDRDILPIFTAKCGACHGAEQRKADLDLTTPGGLQKGGESGGVLNRDRPQASLLWEKIHDGEMPPADETPLSEGESALIGRWIENGAAFSGTGDATATAAPTQQDVIPILLRRCTVCHGPRRQEAGLDLRTKAAMLRGGKSGPAIALGNPAESLLIRRIQAGEMPPHDRLVEVSIKPIEAAETGVLADWIAAGAPEVDVPPDVASGAPDPLVTDADRAFWAFRPPQPVEIPKPADGARIRNAVDAFVLEKLQAVGLSLAPEADRLALLRRASFDLTGLPPEPAEALSFLVDDRADAYEQLIDRLLASERYGERWGRYWLDLAGYADSEGKREQDLPRPHAWRYRDYVIRALNADKPYDRFLLEQIAGDELADYQSAAEITPELYDNLVATGFLRMAPDASWANITGYVPDRLDVIADEIDVLGSAVMGLTLKCARCHSHKFDPLPQRDYYRLVDIFKGAYDEYDWLKPDVRPGLGPVSQDVQAGRLLPHVTTAERQAWQAHNNALDDDIVRLRTARESMKEDDVDFTSQRETLDKQVADLTARKLPEPMIQALWDRGEPSPTYLYRRGDFLNPGALIGPGVPAVLTDGKTPFEVAPPWPGATSTGRRLALAQWLTRPDHPLTSRVLVNRIWGRHFGTGLVRTVSNFGKAGEPPKHPELLDWLAQEFVRQGWRIKPLHRLLMTSAAYRQSSAISAQAERADPENVRWSRMPLMRLDAEALYDSLLLIAGRLDETRYGPADAVVTRGDGLVTPAATASGWRRLIYVQQSRKAVVTHRETFDFPQMSPNCAERRNSTVATQALHLWNNGMVQELAQSFAERVWREAGDDGAAQIDRVYLIALSRPPNEDERHAGVRVLTALRAQWTEQLASVGPPGVEAAASGPQHAQSDGGDEGSRRALATFCHAVLNSAALLYVD